MDKIINKRFVAKATVTETPGEFTALVSTFGFKDSQGDIIDAGAYKKTLEDRAKAGNPLPVVWSHQWSDPESFIGEYTKAEETSDGLLLTGLLDVEDNARAARVHKLMKAGRVVEFSVSGMVTDDEMVEVKSTDGKTVLGTEYHIKALDLWEAGPCFKGANSQTQLLSVKAVTDLIEQHAEIAKEGRILASKHLDALKSAHKNLGDTIKAIDKKPDANTVDAKPGNPAKSPAKMLGKAAAAFRAVVAKATPAGMAAAVAAATDTAGAEETIDLDADPNQLVAAIDATLDEATELLGSVDASTLPPEVQQAIGLIVAAEAASDGLMVLLGLVDPDDIGETDPGEGGNAPASPKPATAGKSVVAPNVRALLALSTLE